MSWEEAMKERAGPAAQDRLSAEANVTGGATSTSWDRHEAWLTRVKQARERAASRFTDPGEGKGRGLSV